jgi:hypothetical protein
MNDDTTFTVPTEGQDELAKLALTLFFEDMKHSEFVALPVETKAAIAQNAKIGVGGLIRALRYAGAYQEAHANALHRYARKRWPEKAVPGQGN